MTLTGRFTAKRFVTFSGFVLLFALFTAQVLYLAKTNSTVSDEVAHIGAGYSYLKYDDFRLNQEHPPLVKQMAALPLLFIDLRFPLGTQAWKDSEQWEAGRAFLFTLGNPAEEIIFKTRAALLPVAFIMALLIFFWARDLFGERAAFFSLFLFSLFPEMAIHASLVTTDFAPAAFYFGIFYFLTRFLHSGKIRDIYLAGLATGLAMASKYSTFAALPLIYLFFIGYAFMSFRTPKEKEGEKSLTPEQRDHSLPLGFMILMTVFVVSHKKSFLIFSLPFIYLWLARLQPQRQRLQAPAMKRAASLLLILLSVAFFVILVVYFEPASWFKGMRMDPFKRFFRGWTIFRDHSTGEAHPSFLFGKISTHGWWYYYLAAMAVKIPIPILISFCLGAVHLVSSRKILRPEILLLLIPPVFYWVIASFINKVNIGVRHILIVYPFLIVTAGAAFEFLGEAKFRKIRPLALTLLGGWLLVTSARAFPNYLSYFNGLAGPLGGKENILGDSNISWGQDLKRLKIWMTANQVPKIYRLLYFNMPEELDYYGIPYEKEDASLHFKRKDPGYYAIDMFNYQGMVLDPEFSWIQSVKPAARVGGSILIYKF